MLSQSPFQDFEQERREACRVYLAQSASETAFCRPTLLDSRSLGAPCNLRTARGWCGNSTFLFSLFIFSTCSDHQNALKLTPTMDQCLHVARHLFCRIIIFANSLLASLALDQYLQSTEGPGDGGVRSFPLLGSLPRYVCRNVHYKKSAIAFTSCLTH